MNSIDYFFLVLIGFVVFSFVGFVFSLFKEDTKKN